EEKRCRSYTFDYTKTESAWYRHYIDFPEKIKDKKVELGFEGVSLISAIFVNGVKLHENIGMFVPFKVDITDQIRPGRNVVALHIWRKWDKGSSSTVALENVDANYADAWNVIEATQKGEMKKLESRSAELVTDDIPHGFYRGCPGGIWRPVKLVISDKLKVEDYYFVPSLDSANIEVTYSNKNASEQYFGKGWQESQATDTLILKLIKVDNQIPSIAPLAWQLKMKNFYKLPYTNIQRESSIFLTYNINGVYYHNIPGYSDFLVTMLKLDRYQNDTYTPPPDKVFDWLPSITIFPQYGEIMFPILEPFCGGLKDAGVSSQYWFCEIYSNDKLQTQSNPKANMYKLRGNLLHN
ncbi:MAG: hypothetical protein MUE56_06580, partial [Ignavibacteria bacterium]|nr:hypothetical protein [Ignavibacteria bacterium]